MFQHYVEFLNRFLILKTYGFFYLSNRIIKYELVYLFFTSKFASLQILSLVIGLIVHRFKIYLEYKQTNDIYEVFYPITFTPNIVTYDYSY